MKVTLSVFVYFLLHLLYLLVVMNDENRKKIVTTVNFVGDELKNVLKPTLEHTQRNSYAHVWRSIKEQFGKSYKECDDADLDKIIEHVLSLRSQKA